MESKRVMLAASEPPLWEIKLSEEETIICENHSVLSATLECLALKSKFHMSEKCFDDMMAFIKSTLPEKNRLPENFYQAKKLVQEERPGCPYVISTGQDLDIPTVLVQQGVLGTVDAAELARAASRGVNSESDDDSEYESKDQHESNNGESVNPNFVASTKISKRRKFNPLD